MTEPKQPVEVEEAEVVDDYGTRHHGFMYVIGQVMRLKSGGVAKAIWAEKDVNVRLTILEQVLIICSAGCAQRQYGCRSFLQGGGTHPNLIRYHEFEIEPAEPFPDDSVVEARETVKERCEPKPDDGDSQA